MKKTSVRETVDQFLSDPELSSQIRHYEKIEGKPAELCTVP